MDGNITREAIIEHAQKAFENVIHLLPETVVYHQDTKLTVEQLPHDDGVQFRFILDVVVSDQPNTPPAAPAESEVGE